MKQKTIRQLFHHCGIHEFNRQGNKVFFAKKFAQGSKVTFTIDESSLNKVARKLKDYLLDGTVTVVMTDKNKQVVPNPSLRIQGYWRLQQGFRRKSNLIGVSNNYIDQVLKLVPYVDGVAYSLKGY